jgi:nitrate reductase NapE component
MEEVKMETTESHSCTTCAKVAEESSQNEEVAMAFLLALVPVISLTFLGQIGLL